MITITLEGPIHRVLVNGSPLRWSAFCDALELQAEVRAALTTTLQNADHAAYFWECCPWPPDEDPTFEFVILPAPNLANRRVNAAPFANHLRTGSGLTRTFLSLRGDAELVVPARDGDEAHFGHLGSWIRAANAAQIDAIWFALAQAINTWRQSDRGTLWVSTAGGGVPWLHLRLDSRPKYYKHTPFKGLL
ncbi:MAG: hypothetical protein AAF938_00665 [Myxococcota bacterium]